jgi:hypothetical protein
MNLDVHCSSAACRKEFAKGDVIYEVGALRYCNGCVKVNVIQYPPLVPKPRRPWRSVVLS